MLDRFLPARIDNTYRGHRAGLWLFGAVVLLKGAIAIGTMVNGYAAATNADGVPLATFTAAGSATVVSLFAAWGLSQLMLNLIGLLALVRYRAMVSLMFVVLLVEHVARHFVFVALPLPRTGPAPGFWFNVVLVAAMIIGLTLSLWQRHTRHARAETGI